MKNQITNGLRVTQLLQNEIDQIKESYMKTSPNYDKYVKNNKALDDYLKQRKILLKHYIQLKKECRHYDKHSQLFKDTKDKVTQLKKLYLDMIKSTYIIPILKAAKKNALLTQHRFFIGKLFHYLFCGLFVSKTEKIINRSLSAYQNYHRLSQNH